jgi:hypothetical protein
VGVSPRSYIPLNNFPIFQEELMFYAYVFCLLNTTRNWRQYVRFGNSVITIIISALFTIHSRPLTQTANAVSNYRATVELSSVNSTMFGLNLNCYRKSITDGSLKILGVRSDEPRSKEPLLKRTRFHNSLISHLQRPLDSFRWTEPTWPTAVVDESPTWAQPNRVKLFYNA